MLGDCVTVLFELLTGIGSRREPTFLAPRWMELRREAFLKVAQLERAGTQQTDHTHEQDRLFGVWRPVMRYENPEYALGQAVLLCSRRDRMLMPGLIFRYRESMPQFALDHVSPAYYQVGHRMSSYSIEKG